MGTSESKMSVVSTPKPDPICRLKNQHLSQLADPRSPSCGIDRTPIQVSGAASTGQKGPEGVGPVSFDPRSPTVGIVRTPLKDSMKVTVSALARRLSTFFLNDVMTGDSAPNPLPPVSLTKHYSLSGVEQQSEQSSKEPLLPPNSHNSLSGPIKCPTTPTDANSSMGYGSFSTSPFVVVGEAKVEVAVDADATIDEAEEAILLGESPLNRELSLSMLGCREGVYSPEFFPSADDRPSTPVPPLEDRQVEDHSYALPCITYEPSPSTPVQEAILQQSAADTVQSPEQECVVEETAVLMEQVLKSSEKSKLESSEPAKSEVPLPAITFPKFDTCSPSQVVFRPQWLGVGFGATGVRARGVQSRGRATSSPLSTRRPATDENENKVVLNKHKQRGKTLIGEGRSPLQILKETNSPRNNAQMKLKVSTPEKQRFNQMDRRALVLSLNKENQ
ncbi:cell division cycle-associated protein 3 [Clarias gariepinus]|uniref:cell division cycle-associated protein 3 n=1 Tax=Clarias gariepinus TaxID=13013 RepID=UPI00234D7301|nr:cell division cycle-associated protein 3 [Clarias gariepinus]XP_053351153.1 cell division cycle-associated protein 3 [Clarias gariepinus]XP_053351154.1 cell division cycle-associated protein 3 [Clarias gariepinus]